MGGRSIRRRWASARCYAATPMLQAPRPRPRRHRRTGRSTRRSPRRCSACLRGVEGRRRTAATSSACTARSARSTRTSSTSTAARSRSAIRSARRARASCCTCSNVLKRTGGKRGMAAICIGGGLGGAMLVEARRETWSERRKRPARSTGARARRRRPRLAHLRQAGATTNTLSREALDELRRRARCDLDREPPKGLVIRSGKANGFIAGADVEEFTRLQVDAPRRMRVRALRLGRVRAARATLPYPDARAGRTASAWAAASSSRSPAATASRVDDPRTRFGAARSDARHRAGMGRRASGCRSWSARRRRSTCCSPARRSTRERAKRIGLVDAGGAAAHHGEHRARRDCWQAPPPTALPFPLSLTLRPAARRFVAAQAAQAGREARAARALSGALRDPRAVGEVRRRPVRAAAGDPALDRRRCSRTRPRRT